MTYAVHIFKGGRVMTLGADRRLPTEDDEVHRVITGASKTYVTHHGPQGVVDDTLGDGSFQRITYRGYVHDDDGLDKDRLERELCDHDPGLVDITAGADSHRMHTALGMTVARHVLELTDALAAAGSQHRHIQVAGAALRSPTL